MAPSVRQIVEGNAAELREKLAEYLEAREAVRKWERHIGDDHSELGEQLTQEAGLVGFCRRDS